LIFDFEQNFNFFKVIFVTVQIFV